MAEGMPIGWDKAVAITPSDTVDILPNSAPIRALYVGGAGNVTGVLLDGTAILFTAPPVGAVIPVQLKRVNATGTTATALVGLFEV